VGGSQPDHSSSTAAQVLLVARFTAAEISSVRQRVEDAARRCGLDRQQTSDWVTAVNELMTNAVRHGGGGGQVRLWLDERLTCEIRDDGPGFVPADYLERADRPTVSATGGMGLWIVQQMTDALSIDSGPGGTTARVSIDYAA
jgi:anti-sigma regulatory factor (Ser/Thr protein kinase)